MIIFLLWKSIFKKTSRIEKITGFVVLILFVLLINIFLVDNFNIPHILGLTKNVDSEIWLQKIIDSTIGIFNTAVGAFVLVWATKYQIDKNNEENRNRDNENLRIQNMPLLKYKIDTIDIIGESIDNYKIKTIFEDNETFYPLRFIIKNVGLNSIENLKVKFQSNVFKEGNYVEGEDSLIVIEKDGYYEVKRYINFKKSDKPYKIEVIVDYQDVLNNSYQQKVEIEYTAVGRTFIDGMDGIINFKVLKEALKKDIYK